MHPFWEIYQSLFRKAEIHTKITCNRTTCCITLQIIIPSPTKLRRDIVMLPSVLPSVRHILVNTLGSTSFNGF